jgi:hypothetical protein
VVKASLAFAAVVMLNAVLVAPIVLRHSRHGVAHAGLVDAEVANVAMPTALTVVVPLSVPPPGFEPRLTVTPPCCPR